MRRIEIINGAESVINAIIESDIVGSILGIIKEYRERPAKAENIKMEIFLIAAKKYLLLASKYNNSAKQLVKIFDIKKLEEPELWAKIIIPSNESLSMIMELKRDIDYITDSLPKIIEMLKSESVSVAIKEIENQKDSSEEKSIMSVIVLEEKNRYSNPQRLKDVLDSIKLLYEACSNIIEIPSNDLCVIACDSGSDKSFDFLGLAKIMECVKEIILDLWDRVVFFRERQLAQRMALVAEALPIIDKIGELERKKSIEPEKAAILRRDITNGACKFLSSGAIIPEMEARSSFNPRLLMAPEPKLLAHPLENKICEPMDSGKEIKENYETKIEFEKFDAEEQVYRTRFTGHKLFLSRPGD